jgi:N-acetylglutamate synthase
MGPQIRPFLPSDYAAARELWEATPGVGLSAADEPAAIAAFLERNPGCSFVAVIDGVLVGTVLAGHDGRRGLIHHLVTAPAERGRGLGRALLRAALKALREAGIAKCHFMVFKTNAEGLEFWRRVGAEERMALKLFSMPTTGGD